MTRFLSCTFLFLSLAVLGAAKQEPLGFNPETEADALASAYFAPENEILFRMRNPDGSFREFQRNFDRPNDLWGANGWRGKIKGDRVTIRSAADAPGGQVKYVFDLGRLVRFEGRGIKRSFAYDEPRLATAGDEPYVFGDEKQQSGTKARKAKKAAPRLDRQVERELLKKWAKSGRLRIPFNNPNENGFLYMTIALCASFLFFFRRKAVKIVGGVLFIAACGALVMTASRGSFLSFAIGLLPAIALRFRTVVRSRAVWALAAIVLAGAVAWFATHESRLLTRGFTKQSQWSNQSRLEMWAVAPKMMADAPDGWGNMHVGRAHLDWYQDLDEVSLAGSLVNEHLTKLVARSRIGRFVYLFGWLAVLGLLGYTAFRTREGVAVGLALAVLVAGWFNPVYDNRWLWVAPAVGIVLFLCSRPWRVWRPKPIAVVLGVTIALAALVQTGLMLWGGSRADARGYPIHVENDRVYVKGINPQTWIVDDGKMLGGVLACKEIRRYYRDVPNAPSIGYVRRIKDLPEGKVHRLVLAGKRGEEWLKAFGKRVETQGEEAIKTLPDELVFITPPFPPEGVPPPYLANCKTMFVIGEIITRYRPGYENPPEWVRVVPGMELYLNGWMRYAMGDF